MLTDVKLLLNIATGDTSKDTLLESLITINTNKLLSYLGGTKVPPKLEFIIVELTIERYNKIGSEGLTAEGIEGITYSYANSADELAPYLPYIQNYLSANHVGKFRFL